MRKNGIIIIILCVISIAAAVIGLALNGSGAGRHAEKAEITAEDCVFSARRYYRQEEYDMAKIKYEEALELDGSSYDALLGYAETLDRMEEYEAEIDAYDAFVALYPEDIDAQISRLWVMMKLGKNDEVKSETEALSKKYPDSEDLAELFALMTPAAPEFDRDSCESEDYFILHLVNGDKETGTVYYTFDGSDPTTYSSCCTDGEIVISYPETELCVATYNSLGYWSEVTRLHFTVSKEPVALTYRKCSQLGNLTDYFNRGYSDTVYNYELAQLRELYLMGNVSSAEESSYECSRSSFKRANYSNTYDDYCYDNLRILEYTPFLKTLAVGYYRSVDLTYISNLSYLKNLSLLNDSITDISPLASLTGLEKLSLGWNSISDISSISGLGKLTILGLWENQITDIQTVKWLTQLQQLDISGNPVEDISSLEGLAELKEVILSDTGVKDISVLVNNKVPTVIWDGEA